MKRTTCLFVAFSISIATILAQSLENTCWDGINQYSGDYWKLEYLSGDSLFMTGYDANGTMNYGRTHFGWYEQSNDTVKFTYFPWHPCGTTEGEYSVKFSNNQMYFTEINDPCPGRASWHVTTERAHIRCDHHEQPLLNTCWAGFQKFTQEYYVIEFAENDSLFLTGYDKNGSITMPRQQHGNYYYSNDTVTFVMDPPGGSCGVDSGVYRFKFLNDKMKLLLVSDACATRVDLMLSDYNYFDCAFHAIDIEEIPLRPAEIQVYPNPASNTLTIEEPRGAFAKNTSVLIYDILGNKQTAKTASKSSNSFTLNVSHLPAGIYILQVMIHHEEVHTERIVISH